MRPTLMIALCMAWFGTAAKSHEFWIEPEVFQVSLGDPVQARLRVGTAFEGSEQSYIPRNFERFDYVLNTRVKEVPGVVGDRPAVNFPAEAEGLVVLVHETTDQRLTWNSWEKFESFLRHKDAAWVLVAHQAAGLPETGVREVYSRYAKSLVAVGDGAGSDQAVGLLTEIVALENPYQGDMTDGMRVQVLYQGQPRAMAQIEVFERGADGEVHVFTAQTDGEGLANVPVKPGHDYMLDAVVLRRPVEQPADAEPFAWESLWANLTFAVPD